MGERLQFVNAPVQNGDFEFDKAPHKLVGMRLADALNTIDKRPASPHLWNLARLSGDIEYADLATNLSRQDFERQRIDGRYDKSTDMKAPVASPAYRTDIDTDTEQAALQLIDEGLSAGNLTIEQAKVVVCLDCGHDLGQAKLCAACGSARTGHSNLKVLYSLRDEADSILSSSDTYGSIKTSYIDAMARHNPCKLPISKTRQAGVALDAFSLEGQVLDPRAGLHVTALMAGEKLGADTVVMLTTASVALKAIAFGMHFRQLDGARLKLGLYGRIPYGDMENQQSGNLAEAEERQFRNWYLPLMSLTSREAVPIEQVGAYRKCFRRICNLGLKDVDVKTQVDSGSLRWITDKNAVASVRPSID